MLRRRQLPVMNENRRCSILFHLLVTTTAWHQAWHLPSLTSNDELMPGCIAGESRDGEVGASCRLLWIGRKSRPFVLSPQCSSMNNARANVIWPMVAPAAGRSKYGAVTLKCSPPRSRYNLAGFHTRLSCAAQGKFRRPRVTESKALPQPGGFLPRYECVSRSGRRSS